MKQFREMFTTDKNIHRQWVMESVERLKRDDRFIFGSGASESGRMTCYVVNKHNGKSYRCYVVGYLQAVGLARCYARATGNKVGCLIRQIPANAAFSYKDVITRDIVFLQKFDFDNKADFLEPVETLGKYRRLTGEIGNYIRENGSVFDKLRKFYVEEETYYDLE